ncbi:hypothetical protein [Undibacterium pigrum]|uniref:Peptidase MA superfamily protein n=1 Tax=Undibacterium pigrum TaxID=401470 RepID=A0A318J354_9BURK|nr:hypothetical protein [Undibacterium pigrum]PXX43046.1 hypothetical protein DFR42_10446 [Undibacterium pigrum]
MKQSISGITRAATLLLILCLLSGCTLIKTGVALMHTREVFVASKTNPDVRYLAGASPEIAEQVANRVAAAIQHSREVVEKAHGAKFAHAPQVYICHADCFTRYVPVTVNEPAAQFGDSIFLNIDALLKREARGALQLEYILTHELTHLLLYQVGGTMAYGRVPAWFREGVALQISQGAGASEFVTMPEAARMLLDGKHFDPAEIGSIFANRTATAYKLTTPMFYREALMFVDFLKANNPAAFDKALHDIVIGKDFHESFEAAYGASIASYWPAFIASVAAITPMPNIN